MEYTMEYREKKIKEFVKKYPWIKDMWKEYDNAYSDFFERVNLIEKVYTEFAKNWGIDYVEFWYNSEEQVCGIDINRGDGIGYDFSKNRMLIREDVLAKEKTNGK